MLTINLDTSTPEENHNWVEFGNSLTGIKYADISVANGGIILDRISVGLQVVDPTFTVEYCPDLLSGVTVIHGKGYATTRSADKTNYTGKKPRPKGKWKSPLFPTASGITAHLTACAKRVIKNEHNSYHPKPS
jgi:hypothetical protein